MARPRKAVVDYFPHDTTHRKTIYILESRWGNDGYAAWFKLLEQLGKSNGHYLDCRNKTDLMYLASKLFVSEQVFTDIMDTLANLDAIDRGLWRHKLVYCQHFVDRVADAYRRRKEVLPTRDMVINASGIVIDDINKVIDDILPLNSDNNPQREREKEKEREREKEIKSTAAAEPKLSVSEIQSLMSKHLGRLTVSGGQIETIRKMSNTHPPDLITKAFEAAGGAGADRLNWVVKWLEDPKNRGSGVSARESERDRILRENEESARESVMRAI